VRADDVDVAVTPYRIVLNLATRHLTLYRSGHRILSAPVGVGLAAYPTPTGHYFVALLAAPPSPGYGAFVMVTSAHSDTITDWEKSGDALIALHGPLGSDRQIATTGAAVSHGCVRLHESDLIQLRPVPAGSPIDIVAA
jgi:lipoprotein-anchoring transpeptidase ErfK/SrfK